MTDTPLSSGGSDGNASACWPHTEEQLEDARIQFGVMFRRWLNSGGWSNKTFGFWAQAAGVPQISNNTVSFICRGTQPKTSPQFFASIGELNRRLAEGDYGQIADIRLRERVMSLKPLRDFNGVWTAVDFFAAYIGVKPFPAEFADQED